MADFDSTVFAFPAAVSQRASQAALLEIAKERASDPEIFGEFPPYFFSATISTDQRDAYYTVMARSTLQQFASDAQAGVAFQDSHKTDGLVRTLGHSLTGKYAGPQGDGVAHTDADFYTLTGMDPAIDSFVRKMRGGLTRDVSVGFYDGQWICSICGRDMMTDWSCYHIPGFSYFPMDKNGEPDKSKEKVLATASIENARLAEVSAVYDGATPGAVILKAQREAEAGRLKPEQARILETRYRIHLPDRIVRGPGVDLPIQEHRMGKHDELPQPATDTGSEPPRVQELISDRIRALFAEASVPETQDLETGVRFLVGEVTRLRPLADDGTAYRADLVEQAVTEGVRLMGPTFPQEAYRTMLATASLDTIKSTRDSFATKANEIFPGGRATVETHPVDGQGDAAPKAGGSDIPDAAYHAR